MYVDGARLPEHVRGVTDGVGTSDPNPRNLVNWCV